MTIFGPSRTVNRTFALAASELMPGLLSTVALGSSPEAVAALLPCFWIYREVGIEIFSRSQDGLASNPYARWIDFQIS